MQSEFKNMDVNVGKPIVNEGKNGLIFIIINKLFLKIKQLF